MNKAVFWDRDGTINIEKNYLYKIDDFEFIPGVIDLMRKFKEEGYLQILITNQSGIARGYYSIDDMKKLNEYMQAELNKCGTGFDAIYFCPHHPDGIVKEFSRECSCRKPGTGLFERAIRDYNIDAHHSIAIGDKARDLIPGEKLGMKTYFIEDILKKQEKQT